MHVSDALRAMERLLDEQIDGTFQRTEQTIKNAPAGASQSSSAGPTEKMPVDDANEYPGIYDDPEPSIDFYVDVD